MKQCNTCQQIKEITLFPIKSKELRRNDCKECYYLKIKTRSKRYILDQTLKTKICSKCNSEKEIHNFNKDSSRKTGYHPQCNECRSLNNHNIYQKNSEKHIKRSRAYYNSNRTKIREASNKRNKYRRKHDPFYLLKKRIRNRLYYSFQRQSWKPDSFFSKSIGCNINTLKEHIEQQFDEGMTWENIGDWHIDHIIPLNAAQTEKQLYQLCHYKNLRPLWAEKNLAKSDKIEYCWQKLKRDIYFEEDKNLNIPINIECSDFQFNIEVLNLEHKKFIEKYEWLGTIGFGVRWVFTARYNGLLGGIVMLSEPNMYQFESKYEALIQRGACASWTPKNLASSLIMFSCRWMVKNTTKRIFTGYSDSSAGEIGTIYQACNFDYLGQNFGTEYLYKLANGKLVSNRYFTRTSSMKKWAKELNIRWELDWTKDNGFQEYDKIPKSIKDYAKLKQNSCLKIKIPLKGKYVLLINYGKEKIQKTWISQPYPKRSICD